VRRGPLASSYLGSVGLVACSLVPYLALVVAVFPLSQTIGRSLGLSPSTMDVTIALSTGAYAPGTVLAAQLAMHLPPRRLLVIYESLFVVASVLAAAAPTGGVFIVAFITQGLCTSLMLIAAVPPLVTSWPAHKMPVTGGIMNLCIFGAVAAGPTLGALQASGGHWRLLFWVVAGIAGLALLLSLLTFADDAPQDRRVPWDVFAVALALVGCAAAFFGAGELEASMVAGTESLVPLLGGFALIVILVIYQYRRRNPLMPVKAIGSTVPVTGLCIALTASAAAFGIMVLVLEVLKRRSTPTHIAALFVPELVGAVLVAVLFGILFRTRFTPVLALGGLLLVVASAVILLVVLPGTGPMVGVAVGLLGLGVAASVSPALFLAGLSLRSVLLQRVFAMIELLRAVTAFLFAPVVVYLAAVLGEKTEAGVTDALWICLGIAAVGFLGGSAVYFLGRPWLEVPDLERWQGDAHQPAWSSPPLLNRLRRTSDRR